VSIDALFYFWVIKQKQTEMKLTKQQIADLSEQIGKQIAGINREVGTHDIDVENYYSKNGGSTVVLTGTYIVEVVSEYAETRDMPAEQNCRYTFEVDHLEYFDYDGEEIEIDNYWEVCEELNFEQED
jgi:hypothetical protein